MLKIFGKGKVTPIYSPFKGEVIQIEKINDPTFSKKMLGDGVGVIPVDGNIYSPADGKIYSIFPTKHIIAIETTGGAEFLIHMGIDTISLKGIGYELKVKPGMNVKRGDILGFMDIDAIKSSGKDITCPVIATDLSEFYINILKDNGNVDITDVLFELIKN